MSVNLLNLMPSKANLAKKFLFIFRHEQNGFQARIMSLGDSSIGFVVIVKTCKSCVRLSLKKHDFLCLLLPRFF